MKNKYLLLLLLLLVLCGCGKSNSQSGKKNVQYCENGTLENGKCKVANTIDPVSITCEDGDFNFNEETRKCENVISIPANRRIGCKDEENYTLKNGACYPKNGKGGVKYKVNLYSCPDSGTLNGSNCDFVDQQDAEVVCPEGYTVNVDKATCEKYTYEEVKEKEE